MMLSLSMDNKITYIYIITNFIHLTNFVHIFRWQTKPRMTIHGDLYYEGKEYETRLKEKKPGDLSEELKTALGMPIGPGSNKVS